MTGKDFCIERGKYENANNKLKRMYTSQCLVAHLAGGHSKMKTMPKRKVLSSGGILHVQTSKNLSDNKYAP